MKGYLLDTHVFLWAVTLSPKLTPSISQVIRDRSNSIFLSVVSAWEISIKIGLGKLEINRPVSQLFGPALADRGITLLPVSIEDVEAYTNLVFLESGHRDPFDRMLVVQAAQRELTLLTADAALEPYGPFVWRI